MIYPKTKRETIDSLMKSLGAFTVLAVAWVVLHLVASATNVGLLGFLAGVVLIMALLAMAAVILVAGSLLRT